MSDTGDDRGTTPRLRVLEGGGSARGGDAIALMPTDPAEVLVLERRARALRGAGDQAEEVDFQAYVRFRLGRRERFGIPHTHVREVMSAGDIARVPGAPGGIRGIISRRGELLAVLDLRHFFRVDDGDAHGGPDAGLDEEAAVLVASGAGLTVGILVDQVEGQDLYDPAQLMPPFPSEGVSDLHHVTGIHDGRVTILNLESLLSDPAIVVDDAN